MEWGKGQWRGSLGEQGGEVRLEGLISYARGHHQVGGQRIGLGGVFSPEGVGTFLKQVEGRRVAGRRAGPQGAARYKAGLLYTPVDVVAHGPQAHGESSHGL